MEGKLRTRSWNDQEGNTRYTTEVHVQDFTFLTNKNEMTEQGASQAMPAKQPTSSQMPESTPAAAAEEDDDLPF